MPHDSFSYNKGKNKTNLVLSILVIKLLFKCSKFFKKCGFLSLNHKDLHFQNSQDLFSEYSDTNEIEKQKSAHLKEAYDFSC